jgi:hypothetical protein
MVGLMGGPAGGLDNTFCVSSFVMPECYIDSNTTCRASVRCLQHPVGMTA